MQQEKLVLDSKTVSTLDASFAAAFGGAPTRYFSAPAEPRLAAITPITSEAEFWQVLSI